MSGGVDSAVAASVLKDQGHNVEAVFMKNWDEDDTKFCTAAQDYKDALQACDTSVSYTHLTLPTILLV